MRINVWQDAQIIIFFISFDVSSFQNGGWYKTTFTPPKKEQREKKLSANIQKFLAKKEEEEKKKRLEADKKKQVSNEFRFFIIHLIQFVLIFFSMYRNSFY